MTSLDDFRTQWWRDYDRYPPVSGFPKAQVAILMLPDMLGTMIMLRPGVDEIEVPDTHGVLRLFRSENKPPLAYLEWLKSLNPI